MSTGSAVLQAAHVGSAAVVAVAVVPLLVIAEIPALAWVIILASVITGQAAIGWGRDLAHHPSDRAQGHFEKPLVLEPAAIVPTRLGCALMAIVSTQLAVPLVIDGVAGPVAWTPFGTAAVAMLFHLRDRPGRSSSPARHDLEVTGHAVILMLMKPVRVFTEPGARRTSER